MNYERSFIVYAKYYSILNFSKHKNKFLQIHLNVYWKISQNVLEKKVKLFKEKMYLVEKHSHKIGHSN